MSDQVNNPPHYKGINGIEAIDVIEGFELGFRLGSTVTYILRADRKGFALTDLRKARWFLDREIEERAKNVGSTPKTDVTGGNWRPLCDGAAPRWPETRWPEDAPSPRRK